MISHLVIERLAVSSEVREDPLDDGGVLDAYDHPQPSGAPNFSITYDSSHTFKWNHKHCAVLEFAVGTSNIDDRVFAESEIDISFPTAPGKDPLSLVFL